MLIDCDSCAARGDGCGDCVVSLLLTPPPVIEWDEDERRALGLLADAGLLPRLRLVTPLDVRPAAGATPPPLPAPAPFQPMIPLAEPYAPGPRPRPSHPGRRSGATGPAGRGRRAG